jgi:UDP-2,3-diacylglucosamine hydrolase
MMVPEFNARTVLIISDVHLGGFDSLRNLELMHTFSEIVDYCILNNHVLVINGDLLDYYMQYPDFIPEVAQQAFTVLQSYVKQSATPPIYITGNHDNWDDGYIEKIGCETIHEEKLLTIDGKKVFIAHGDGLNNPSYKLPRPSMHRMLRNKRFVRYFKFFTTGPLGNQLMKWFSMINRWLSADNKKTIRRIDTWAESMLCRDDIDVIVAAHHHNTRFTKFDKKLYINTGCFFKDKTAALYTNGDFRLVKWDMHQRTFIPF